jgi:hypothetical protein
MSVTGPGNFSFNNTGELRVTSGGGGGTSDVNIIEILGNPVALNNPLFVELSDGTNPFGTQTNPLSTRSKAQGTFGSTLSEAVLVGGEFLSDGSLGAFILDDNNALLVNDQFPENLTSTTTPLGSGGTVTNSVQLLAECLVNFDVFADQSGTLQAWISVDTNTAHGVQVINKAVSANTAFQSSILVPYDAFLIYTYTNGGTPQTLFAFHVKAVNSTTLLPTTLSALGNLKTSLADIAGTAISVNNGTTDAGTQRVTLSSDSTGQVKLATGANVIGSLAANQSVNQAQVAGTATSVNAGATDAGTQRVTLSSGTTVGIAAGSASIGAVTPATVAVATPGLTDGAAVSLSSDVTGSIRITAGSYPQNVQKTNNSSSGSVASLVKAFGSNVVKGNTLIVTCGVGNVTQPTVTDSLGTAYSIVVNKASAAHNISIFAGIAPSSGANTVTVTNGGANASIAMEIYEYSGLFQVLNAICDGANSQNATSTTPASAQVTPLCPNSIAIGCVGIGTAAQTFTVTNGTLASPPVWTNDSGQLNPTTPAGLFSFISLSAFMGRLNSFQLTGTITSEPWTCAVAVFRPLMLPMMSAIQGADPNTTSSAGLSPNPVLVGANDAVNNVVRSLTAFGPSGAALGVTIGLNSVAGNIETNINPVSQPASGGGSAMPAFLPTAMTSGVVSGATASVLRTPNVFRGSMFSAAGSNTIWAPQTGKKARLMKYMIEVGEDATISGGPTALNLCFSQGLGSASGATQSFNTTFGYVHRIVVPAAVLATSGTLYQSNWIDLGNGTLLANSSAPLTMGIMSPQTTSAVNPTWTIASNQWEACTVGFKTTGNLGNFHLVQTASVSNTTGSTTITTPAIATATGNSIFIFIRTTNIAGGAPTVAVSDTAANTYTTTALTTNASDGANGSSLLMAYSIGATGNAANVLTVTFSVHIPADSVAYAFEYSGTTGGIDSALVGTTGNSTSPASGNYTPGTSGDLIFSFFASAANIAAAPTIGSNFRPISQHFAASAGSLGVADNFGNTALTAGQINVVCCGTEE